MTKEKLIIRKDFAVDIVTKMKKDVLRVGKKAYGELLRDELSHFTFTETDPKVRKPKYDRQVHDVARTLHGQIGINEHHTILMMYIPHEDCSDGRELCDIITSEAEALAENVCDIDFKATLEKLKKRNDVLKAMLQKDK